MHVLYCCILLSFQCYLMSVRRSIPKLFFTRLTVEIPQACHFRFFIEEKPGRNWLFPPLISEALILTLLSLLILLPGYRKLLNVSYACYFCEFSSSSEQHHPADNLFIYDLIA